MNKKFTRKDAAMLIQAARKAPLADMETAEQLNGVLQRFADFADNALKAPDDLLSVVDDQPDETGTG